MKDALGLVEVAGLATAIHVADAMVKSANVVIIDIEKAKGSGWMTVKVRGDVGAVQAAVQAGAAQAEQFGHLIAQKVIPRPAEGLDAWLLASGGNAVLQGFAEETTADDTKANTDVSKTAVKKPKATVEKPKATADKPKVVDEAKAAKTDMPATAKVEAATELDETKSALLEVFKPGSTAKAEAKSTTATSKSSTATKSSATASGTASKASSTAKATSSTTPKGAPKKRPSRAKTTKPKA
ncbi:BMC domain-containing protein [Veillonella intestinalis]|uniref:BMC domain-containing protein n=1 Tax=Veillonella intestinalis TaxID=2941341 RepID=UPI0030B9BEFA